MMLVAIACTIIDLFIEFMVKINRPSGSLAIPGRAELTRWPVHMPPLQYMSMSMRSAICGGLHGTAGMTDFQKPRQHYWHAAHLYMPCIWPGADFMLARLHDHAVSALTRIVSHAWRHMHGWRACGQCRHDTDQSDHIYRLLRQLIDSQYSPLRLPYSAGTTESVAMQWLYYSVISSTGLMM